MLRLDRKVVVITGAGGGLGSAMAVAFAREGAAVVCQDLREEAAATTAERVSSAVETSRALAWACDVTDEAGVEAMFDLAQDHFGVVDVLVSNAGVQAVPGDGAPAAAGLEQLLAMTEESWSRMLEIHLTGAFHCSRAMIRRLLAAGQGGSIVCISSVVALGGVGPIHYAAAKAGLHGLVRALAQAGGAHGIRANAVCPGMISTPMTDALPAEQEWVRRRTPLGRLGTPDDVASLCVYLAADESSFVTGQTISANGGFRTS